MHLFRTNVAGRLHSRLPAQRVWLSGEPPLAFRDEHFCVSLFPLGTARFVTWSDTLSITPHQKVGCCALFGTNMAGRKFGEAKPSPLGKVARRRRDGRGAAPTNSWRRTRANWRGTSPDLADARPPSPKGRALADTPPNSNLSFCFCTLRNKNQRARVGTLVFL